MIHWISKRAWRPVAGAATGWLLAVVAVSAQDRLPVLKVGAEIYSNVVVTSVSATDIYFDHAKGMGNAKLKNLDPELQKRFKFNAAKAGEAEQRQRYGNLQSRVEIANRLSTDSKVSADDDSSGSVTYDDGDPVVDKLYAKTFRGSRPPQIVVEKWLTPPPNVDDKFVLVEFWASWAEPCRQEVPHLNELLRKFKNRLVVIGLSDEPVEEIQKMTSPTMDYCVGTDSQKRTFNNLGVQGIPHAILIDPKGIVRFEGVPVYLTEKDLAKLIEKYSE